MKSFRPAGDRVIVKLEYTGKANAEKSSGMRKSPLWRICSFDSGESLKIPEETVLREALFTGMHISESQFEKLKTDSEIARGKEQLLNLLSYRSRSETELKQRLQRSGMNTETSDAIIADLKRLNLVDDEQFAKIFVHDLVQRKPSGEFLIRSELQKKGIEADIINKVIDQEFNEVNQVELAQKGMQQWLSRHPGSGPAGSVERHKKIAKFLYQRGFTWSTIEQVIGDSNAFA